MAHLHRYHFLYRAAEQAASRQPVKTQPLFSLTLIGSVDGKKTEVSRGNLSAGKRQKPVFETCVLLSKRYQVR